VADAESALAAIAAQQQRQQGLRSTQQIYLTRDKTQAVRQKLGLGSELGGMDNRRAALLAQSDMATAQAAEALAYVALYKALGAAPLYDIAQAAQEAQP